MARRLGLFALKNGADRHSDLIATMRAILEALAGSPEPIPEPPHGGYPKGHIETTVTDEGRISTPYGAAPLRVSRAIMSAWPRDLWTDAARMAYLEADQWSITAERNTLSQAGGRCNVPIGTVQGVPVVSEDSIGLFQVNICAWDYTREQMLDPDQNARAGYAIYREQGWSAWRLSARTLGLR